MRAVVLALLLAACAPAAPEVARQATAPALFPGETAEIRRLVNRYADRHEVPRSLVHRVIQRESDYRPRARNGPYYGMMQILPQTARTMGHRGPPGELLRAETNLRWAVRYLRGAWLLSGGDEAGAVRRYASGYYYEARNRCLLRATGLRATEVRRHCPDGSAPPPDL
ncbi:transglycosylase-like protein with SLT domain [Hasllibacter halocynthiae]|uniref:Transglycosylase-like protein with SLT domain n=1 Tax=Hasllibacter halocynthiae TaxID=595589 RepID=A0A2T0X443_9RHOB|nr:lytic transglycosylase domain-containing protein [Hasllibacter halocynthiae]PRY93712.1 transglycosylase-like protein with SLT domain [Hasllibacter halocynthiae]